MTFVAIPSIKLSETSKQAWKAAGGFFPRRDRTVARMVELGENADVEFILNLGWSQFNPETRLPVWNRGEDIQALLWPGMTRDLFDDLMPPQPEGYPADIWIKTPGRGGRGKYHKMVYHQLSLPNQWDWQTHVEGQEYRVITVGQAIVQQFERGGDNEDRSYSWTPRDQVPMPVKAFARQAASRVFGNNVIAWDLIQEGEYGRPYLFEGNTCPGMSTHTAARIVAAIQEQQEAHNA